MHSRCPNCDAHYRIDADALLFSADFRGEERMAQLESVTYPQPNREFIEATFEAFAAQHPWVGPHDIRPKSVARELYSDYASFEDGRLAGGLRVVDEIIRGGPLVIMYAVDLEAVEESVREHGGNTPQADDITIVLARRLPE